MKGRIRMKKSNLVTAITYIAIGLLLLAGNQGQTKQSVVWLFWRVYGCRDRVSLEIFLLERSRQQAEI